MRTITSAQQAVLDNGNQAERVRVQVKDSGGTWRDLTTYAGSNMVKSVTWGEQIDQPHATFTVALFREQYLLSLSPFMTASALNKGFDPAGSFAALIAANRELKIEVAIVAMDTQPSSGDWVEYFHGRIDSVDPGQAETVELTGRAIISGRLAQQYTKVERVYSYAVDGGHAVALRVWEANQVYAAGEYLLPATRGASDPGFNKFLKIHTAGTSGTTEPIWTTGSNQTDGSASWDYVGAPTTSGNPVEQVMQNILDNNKAASDSAVTLYTPTSPSWNILQFIQQREFTLDGLLALANQIGWDVRSKWRTGTAQFELTFYQPTRTSPTVNFTFGKSDYQTPTQLKVDISTIRNVVRVIYGDASDLWPDGTPKRKIVEVSDSTSITKYGELWMELQEDQTSQVDSSTEANALANAALSDLKEPTAELDVPLSRGFPWVELNDYYTFSANGLQFDTDQSLAVVQFQHTSEQGKGLRTKLQTRGLPTIGAQTYLRKRVNPKVQPKFKPHQFVHFNGTQTPSLSTASVVGGVHLPLAQTFDKNQLPEEYEHHVYTSSGATLDNTTLAAVTRDRHFTPAHLIAGKQYYHKVVARYRNADRLVRGQPSAETGFIAGRALAGHLSTDPDLTNLPLNGGFETQQDSSAPPDHVAMHSGTWSTDVELISDGSGKSGANYVHFKSTAVAKEIRFDPFLVAAGALYRLDFLVKDAASGHAQCTVRIKWLDNTKAEISGGELTVVSGGVPLWALGWGAVVAPSTARWARVDVFQTSSGDANGFYVDKIQVRQVTLSGLLVFGSGTLPASNVTNYLQPGGGQYVSDTTERQMPIVLPDGGAALLAGMRYLARTAQSGMTYALTLRQNGADTAMVTTVTTGQATGGDTSDFVFVNDADALSVKCVATQTGGGAHTGALDAAVVVGIYS